MNNLAEAVQNFDVYDTSYTPESAPESVPAPEPLPLKLTAALYIDDRYRERWTVSCANSKRIFGYVEDGAFEFAQKRDAKGRFVSHFLPLDYEFVSQLADILRSLRPIV